MIAPVPSTKTGEHDSTRNPLPLRTRSLLGGTGKPKPASEQRFARGAHLLCTTFDEKNPRWTFNHDVKIRTRGEQLTMIVLDDLNNNEQKADTADAKRVQGGFGDLSKDDTAKLPAPHRNKSHYFSPNESSMELLIPKETVDLVLLPFTMASLFLFILLAALDWAEHPVKSIICLPMSPFVRELGISITLSLARPENLTSGCWNRLGHTPIGRGLMWKGSS